MKLLVAPSLDTRTNLILSDLQDDFLSVHKYSPLHTVGGFEIPSALRGLDEDYLLFLSCPVGTTSGETESKEANTSFDAIELLLHVAGTEVYSCCVLATSGFSVIYDKRNKSAEAIIIPRASDSIVEGVKLLDESVFLDIPIGSILMQESWLNVLAATTKPDTGKILGSFGDYLGLGSQLALLLRHELTIRSFGMPLPTRFGAHNTDAIVDLLDLTRTISSVVNGNEVWLELTGTGKLVEPADELAIDDGSPGKIALFLPLGPRDLDECTATIACGFANEQHYGHRIRLFAPISSGLVGQTVETCPDVSIELLDQRILEEWKPDICLAPSAELVNGQQNCQKILIPEQELCHADWLPSLPIESLRSESKNRKTCQVASISYLYADWYQPQIDLVVITNNRPLSLHRLLTSLRSTSYFSDPVNLYINLEQTADNVTTAIVRDSSWPFGVLTIRHRIVLGGLMPSVVESWYPANNDNYGVFLEDDVEVSPHFYAWLKYTILCYRYGPLSIRAKAKRMLGVSLYQPKNIELRPEGRQKFDAHSIFSELSIPPTLPYLSQIPCSWGAAYFPEQWREFHDFLSLRLGEITMELSDSIVPDIRSNRWPRSWKRYMIELIYLRGYTMLYPNYENFRSLSTNHLELGTHVKDDLIAQKRRDAFEVPLLQGRDSILEGLQDDRLPLWESMPVFDLWGSVVTQKELLARSQVTKQELALCLQTGEDEEEADADAVPSYDAGDLLFLQQPGASYGRDAPFLRLRAMSNGEREALLNEREADISEREMNLAAKEKDLATERVLDNTMTIEQQPLTGHDSDQLLNWGEIIAQNPALEREERLPNR